VLLIVTVDGQDPGLDPISLTLEAKAGRAYRAEGKSVGSDKWSTWIVDTATNEVVSGRRP
jgi:hypothetical protein